MSHIYEFFIVANTPTSDNSGLSFWWHTPLGFSAILLLAIVCVVNIFHRGINDGLFIRVYYWVLFILSLVAMLHVVENTLPKHQLQMLLLTFIIKAAYSTVRRLHRFNKTGKAQENND